jgi:hypothetical protein
VCSSDLGGDNQRLGGGGQMAMGQGGMGGNRMGFMQQFGGGGAMPPPPIRGPGDPNQRLGPGPVVGPGGLRGGQMAMGQGNMGGPFKEQYMQQQRAGGGLPAPLMNRGINSYAQMEAMPYPQMQEGGITTLPDGTQQFQMNPGDDPNADKIAGFLEDPNAGTPGYQEPLGGPEDITEFGTGDGSFPHMPPDEQPPLGQGPVMTGGGGGGFPEGQPPGMGYKPVVDPGDPDVRNSGYPQGTLDPALGRSLQDVALQGLQNTPDYDAMRQGMATRAIGQINENAAARGAFGGSANRGNLAEGLGRLDMNVAQLQGNLRNQALQGGIGVNQNIFGVNRDIYGMNQMANQQAWQNAMNAAGQPTSPSPWQNFFSATGNLGGQIYNANNSPWS